MPSPSPSPSSSSLPASPFASGAPPSARASAPGRPRPGCGRRRPGWRARVLVGVLALSAAPAHSDPAGASPPLTVVVPFAARGPTDTLARALAAAITEQTGQTVVVENRPGAGGTVGASRVARAAADGRTLLLHHVGMATAPALYRTLPYDPRRDFDPVGRVADVPMTLVARPGLPVRGLADAIRLIRGDAASIVVAYAGLGAASHLCGLLLSLALEVDLIQVPYAGTGPALADLQAGQADLMCDQTTNTTAAIRAGRIVALGVVGSARLSGFPDLPSVAEVGVRGLDLSIWHGLYSPRGVPPQALARLTRLLQAGLQSDAFVRAMADWQVVVASREQATPAALRHHLASEIARWTPLIRKAGQYAD